MNERAISIREVREAVNEMKSSKTTGARYSKGLATSYLYVMKFHND